MAEKNFTFISPAIVVSEIDNSGLTADTEALGPVIIGRTQRGPGMRPVKAQSFSEFVDVFGTPLPGGEGGDIWRDGNKAAPLYAAYAAQAWLKAGIGPVTMVRLLGEQHADYVAGSGEAGWKTTNSITGVQSTNGGAYGLFLIDSGSATQSLVGGLAAVWYLEQGAIALSGAIRSQSTSVTGSAVLIESIGPDKEFRVIITDSAGNLKENTAFNFNPTSAKYIRNVFNTNPQLVNQTITRAENRETYWLGESFERHINTLVSGAVSGEVYGAILALGSGSVDRQHMDGGWKNAETGWFVGQDLSLNAPDYVVEQQQKLFKFVTLDNPEWTQNNVKISITDITGSSNLASKYGTFTVLLRIASDSDAAVQVVERFTNCTLNPNSNDYIARKIGDKYVQWSYSERRHREYGKFDNRSKFVRVVVNDDVDAGAIDPLYIPFGVLGPPRFMGFTVSSGSANPLNYGATQPFTNKTFSDAFVKGNDDIPLSYTDGTFVDNFIVVNPDVVGLNSNVSVDFTGSFQFPRLALRNSASDGGIADPKTAYWGIHPYQSATSTKFDKGYGDYLRTLPIAISSFASVSDAPNGTEYQFAFSLDDIETSGTAAAYWLSGSRAAGTSLTAVSSSWEEVLNQGYNRFTTCLHGGFDGLNIKEKEPFRNTGLNGVTETTSYAYNSIKRAIDTVADPEVVECNLMAVPGITEDSLTDHLLEVCQNRADALAVIDLEGDFVPSTENTQSYASRVGSVDLTVSNLKNREINTSYGCAYYPWAQIKDSETGNLTFVPPSVIALGIMANSEAKSQVFFAPAGFNRGGLKDGSGLAVVGVTEKLSSTDRNKLYSANINPFASFPGDPGLVCWGNKTLQTTRSALDRVNVRRLVIFLKKKISTAARDTLFEQNNQASWIALKNKIEPILSAVKAGGGIDKFKLILDETTTTPDLQDRNVVYGKLMIVPTKSIEAIFLDLSIDKTGASFAE